MCVNISNVQAYIHIMVYCVALLFHNTKIYVAVYIHTYMN